ncbi:hypothetical protein NLJ89_g9575 [Agrocybe chaxingu]|uniref:Uncharacterized protein n=1 Tax=Agrocybe chaxingu TaxID=84603 RepID=A0A9W8K0C1_9AGAR|nr:hypothetical protein NLJ89_g9575 [Agrocybe chaxingu]
MSSSLSPLLTRSLGWTGIGRTTRRRIAGRPPFRSLPHSPTQGSPRNAVALPLTRQASPATLGLDNFGLESHSRIEILPDEVVAIIVHYARWRAIVFSTPSLWTNVALPPHISDETEISRCVSEWVQRAVAISSNHSLCSFDFVLPRPSSSSSIRTLSLAAPGYTPSFLPLLFACPYIEECLIAYDESSWFKQENDWEVINVAQEERHCMPRMKKLTVVRPPRNALLFMSKALCAPELKVVEVLLRESVAEMAEVERDVNDLCEASRVERKEVKLVYLTKEEWEVDARNGDHKRRRGWGV